MRLENCIGRPRGQGDEDDSHFNTWSRVVGICIYFSASEAAEYYVLNFFLVFPFFSFFFFLACKLFDSSRRLGKKDRFRAIYRKRRFRCTT